MIKALNALADYAEAREHRWLNYAALALLGAGPAYGWIVATQGLRPVVAYAVAYALIAAAAIVIVASTWVGLATRNLHRLTIGCSKCPWTATADPHDPAAVQALGGAYTTHTGRHHP